MVMPSMAPSALGERIAERLAKFIGRHTGRVAVKTFSLKALGRGPETLTVADWPKLEAALRPMLRTLVGSTRAEAVLRQIREEIGA